MISFFFLPSWWPLFSLSPNDFSLAPLSLSLVNSLSFLLSFLSLLFLPIYSLFWLCRLFFSLFSFATSFSFLQLRSISFFSFSFYPSWYFAFLLPLSHFPSLLFLSLSYLSNHCPVVRSCKIHRLLLCRGLRPPPTNECPDVTLSNLMVRFK